MLTSDVTTHIIWSHKASVTVRAVMTIIMSMHSYDVDFKSTRTDACVITVIALVFPDASVCLHVCLHVLIEDLLTGEASLTDHTLILLTFIVHALNVPSQRTRLSELVPALRALVPPLPTMHCTFMVLQVAALTEPFPTDITLVPLLPAVYRTFVLLHVAALDETFPTNITLVRLLSCVGAEVALVGAEMISVVATLPAAILPSLPHGVHLPPVLLQRGGRRQSHLTHVTAMAAA